MSHSKLEINPSTKVAEVLEVYPQLEEVLISLSPQFSKLKNPVLRRTVARFATLESAAKMAGIPSRSLVGRLRESAGLDALTDLSQSRSIEEVPNRPGWVQSGEAKESVSADEIIARRENPELGPFVDLEDFSSFLNAWGITINDPNEPDAPKIPLYFSGVFNFKIQSTGQSKNATREIVAIVYDFDKVEERLESFLEEENEKKDENTPEDCKELKGDQLYQCLCKDKESQTEKNKCFQEQKKKHEKAAQKGDNEKKQPSKLSPPRIVYWIEK